MLTDAQCRNAVCSLTSKRERLSDSGGLYLEVASGGSRRWFWKYRHDGKEGRLVTLPLFRVVLNPRFTRPFYAVPRTSAARTASG